jgi:hypothetical protein
VFNLAVEHITATGDKFDQPMVVITKSAAEFANALIQPLFANMHIPPDCLHQFWLG